MPTNTAGIIDTMNQLQARLDACESEKQELRYENAARLDALHQSRQQAQEYLLALECIADGVLAHDAPIVQKLLGRGKSCPS